MTILFKGMLTTVKMQEFNCSECSWRKGFEVYLSDCLRCTNYSWKMKPAIIVECTSKKAVVVPIDGCELGERISVDISDLKPINETCRTWNVLQECGIKGVPCIEGRKENEDGDAYAIDARQVGKVLERRQDGGYGNAR